MLDYSPRKSIFASAMARNLFYIFLVLCFCLGAFFKQFDLFYPKPFVVIAFSGAIGLLIDYALRIKNSLWVLVPALLATEILGDLIFNAQLYKVSFYIYLVGLLLYPVYGLLFIRQGIRIRQGKIGLETEPGWKERNRNLSWKFIILGLCSISMTMWEYATYFPVKYNTADIVFKITYLATFAWLLFMDITTRDLEKRGFKTERQILTLSLMVIAIMYFTRFIFK